MKIQLRPYQVDAVNSMARHDRGICVAPAGSGKTIIGASLVCRRAQLIQSKSGNLPCVIWLAHTHEQAQQGRDALESVGFAAAHVACYASMTDTSSADIIIVDECHWAGAPTVKSLIDAANPRAAVYGLTATPLREDGVDITNIIGPVIYVVQREEIQAVGGVLPAVVRVVQLGNKDELTDRVNLMAQEFYTSKLKWCDGKNNNDEQWKRCQYRAVVNIGIRDNPSRDAKIAHIAGQVHGSESVLVLVDSKDHGKKIAKLVHGATFVCSGIKGRAKIIEAFRQGDIKCLVCTSLADEGLDTPVASVLIMAGAGKAFGKIIQRTGRVLRPYNGKHRGLIYDFQDIGHGMLIAQHWRRRKVYKSAGYRIEVAAI